MAIRLTSEEVYKRFKDLYNGEYELLSTYTSNTNKHILKHKVCGTEFEISRLTRFFNESSPCPCPNCRTVTNTRYTPESFTKKIKSIYNNKYTVINFDNMKKPVTLKCECGHTFTVATGSEIFLKGRFRGCPICNPSKRGKHQMIDNYLQSIFDRCDDSTEYEWREEYKGNNKIKHRIFHKKCNKEYYVRPADFLHGYRCPHCAKMRSRSENDMFLDILKISPHAIQSERTQINPYELDIFIPNLNLAIEYNGLHWHSEKIKGRNYHVEKMQRCSIKGIHLVQIFEDEWKNNKDAVLSYISQLASINIVEVSSKSCYVKRVDRDLSLKFLKENQIKVLPTEDYDISYALIYNTQPIFIMNFKKNDNNHWKITDYASSKYTKITDTILPLINAFVDENKPHSITVDVDLRLVNPRDNIFKDIGFRFSEYKEAEYFYTDGHKRYLPDEFSCEKIKEKFPSIYNSDLTELEMMDKTYIERIWDAGRIRYEKNYTL